MEFDDDEYKATQDLHYQGKVQDILNKSIYQCTEQELRLRIKYDEEYIKRLEAKISLHRHIYEISKDCYEEFE